jgi:hypothetical protein
MRLYLILLLVSMTVFNCNCGKDNGEDAVTTHCHELINEPLDPSDNGKVHVATAFTPNGDGLNDVFHPLPIDVASVSVKVYGDDSQIIYFSTTMGGAWNPGPGITNTRKKFYYRVEAVTLQGKKIGYCGEIWAVKCMAAAFGQTVVFEDQATPTGFTGATAESLPSCN